MACITRMKKQFYIFLYVFAGLISCQTEEDNSVQIIEKVRPETSTILIDTIDYNKYSFWPNDMETSWLSKAQYYFKYIGPQKDTIFFSPQSGLIPPPPPPGQAKAKTKYNYPKRVHVTEKYEIDWLEDRNYLPIDTAKIDIKIDTTIKFNNSYPVFLRNTEPDTIFIGYGRHVPLIMEAKDSTGKWNPIEERTVYSCGNGVNSIFLPPTYMAITLAPIFKGSFRTDLRLTLGKNHSNIFRGNIHYRQFESKFTDRGDYKEEYKIAITLSDLNDVVPWDSTNFIALLHGTP